MSALPQPRTATTARRSARAAAAPRLTLVTPPPRSRRYIVAMVALITMAVFGSVSLNAMAAEQSFAAKELDAEVRELKLRTDELTVEIARLESPDRIRAVAAKHLGMVSPTQPGYLVVDDSTSAAFASFAGTMHKRPGAGDRKD